MLGVVHLRDLVGAGRPGGRDHAGPALFLPETLRVTDAMRQLRQQRQQFALVVDERGAIDGIVTMEDLVEEVVGEIYDETDRDVAGRRRGSRTGRCCCRARFPIHDLPDIGVDLEELRTTATTPRSPGWSSPGSATSRPRRARSSTLPGFTAEVVEVTGRAVTKVRLRAKREAPDEGGQQG